MQDITVRKMEFEFPEQVDPVFIEGSPEESYSLIGLSLLLPYLEPYLIRTMKVAKKQLTDPDLIADLERFSAQEGHHFRQHVLFNAAIQRQGFPKLAELEAELEADYQRFSKQRSLRFNLAYAEGFEALTTAAAQFSFETRDPSAMSSAIGDLMAWHMIEELEHRTVAFDVYDRVCGGYFYRLGIGLFGQWHMLRFITRVTRYMIAADPEAMERHGGEVGRKERARMKAGAARRGLLPKLLRTYRPSYTPHDIEFTAEMAALAQAYTQRAVKVS
jgi:predicted metal-dependent hydrolase